MKLHKNLLLAASLLLAGNALAHTDEYLDTQSSPHGGQVRMTDTHHLELVIQGKEITVYVMNHGNEPMPSAGMEATATILSGGTKVDVKLEPQGPNLLKGTGDFALSDEMKVVISILSLSQQARFTPMQKPGNAPPAAPMPGHDMGGMSHH